MLSRQVLPILLVLLTASNDTTALQFSTDEVAMNGFQDDPLVFIDRMYVPYGPNLVSTPKQTDQPRNGYAYGRKSTSIPNARREGTSLFLEVLCREQ